MNDGSTATFPEAFSSAYDRHDRDDGIGGRRSHGVIDRSSAFGVEPILRQHERDLAIVNA